MNEEIKASAIFSARKYFRFYISYLDLWINILKPKCEEENNEEIVDDDSIKFEIFRDCKKMEKVEEFFNIEVEEIAKLFDWPKEYEESVKYREKFSLEWWKQ